MPVETGPTPSSKNRAVLISVALSLGLPLLGVTQHPALWSPDFPHNAAFRLLARAITQTARLLVFTFTTL